MMDLTEEIICNCVKSVSDSMVLPWDDKEIDFTAPWKREKYGDLFKEYAGIEMDDQAGVLELAKSLGLETEGVHHDVLVNGIFEEKVEDSLVGPVFVIDYPASICPLTKRKQGNPDIAERFELFIPRNGAGQCLYRVERSEVAGRPLPDATRRHVRRRLDGQNGSRFRAGAESRHATGWRTGNRNRSTDHDSDRRAEYSRRDLLPAASS